MPATAERDAAIAKATANAQYQEEQYETKQALRVAQSSIGSLQVIFFPYNLYTSSTCECIC